MGVIVNKEKNESDELSRRIDADLRSKLSGNSYEDGTETDFVDDAEYLKNSKKTSKFAWVWVILVILATVSLVSIVFL